MKFALRFVFISIMFSFHFFGQVTQGNALQTPKAANAEQYRFEWNRLLPKDQPTTPVIAPEKFNEAIKNWLKALSANDLKALLSLSCLPFYYDDHMSASEPELRADYGKALKLIQAGQAVDAAYVGHISMKDIRNGKRAYYDFRLDSFLKDNDLVVSMACRYGAGQDNPYFFIRPQGQQLQIIGFSADTWSPFPPPPPPPPPPPVLSGYKVEGADAIGDLSETILLTLSKEPTWMLGKTKVSRNELGRVLRSGYERRANKDLAIKAFREMPYRELIDVIDMVKGAGNADIRLTLGGASAYDHLRIVYISSSTTVPAIVSSIAIPTARYAFPFRDYDCEGHSIVISETGIYIGSKAISRENASKENIAAAVRSTRTPFTLNEYPARRMVLFVDGAVSVGSFLDFLDLCGDLKEIGIELVVKETTARKI
jgi:hypothetical protein